MEKQKGSVIVIIPIAIIFLLISLSAYLFLQNKKLKENINPPTIHSPTKSPSPDHTIKSLSSTYVYAPEANKAKIFLYAPDEKQSVVENEYCGAPVKGAKTYSGHYKLILDASTTTSDNPGGISDLTWQNPSLDIGEWSFVENTYWDGKIKAETFDPSGYADFIPLYYYGSCNSIGMVIFYYDLEDGILKKIPFKSSKGNATDSTPTSPGKLPSKSKDGNLVTKIYSQFTGKFTYSEWQFIRTEKIFKEIKTWESEN